MTGHSLARETLLTPEETAKMLGLSVHTLANWRCTGRSPLRFRKLSGELGRRGGKIRYHIDDVRAFIERC